MSKLKVGVIGTGRIAEEHLRFLSRSDVAELVAVCDLSEALARYAASRFGASKSDSNHEEMLRCEGLDVVHVLTPLPTHKRIVASCLRGGAHVICEKPIALTQEDFRELWRLAEESGLRLIEDHNYRFNRPVLRLESLIAQGCVGDVKEVEVRLAARLDEGRHADPNLPAPSLGVPAGVLHEFITHLTYLLMRFLPEFDTVDAAWRKRGKVDAFEFDSLDAMVWGKEVQGSLHFSPCTLPESLTLTIRGDRGTVAAELFHPEVSARVPRRVGNHLTPMFNQLANGLSLVRSSFVGFKDKLREFTPLEGIETFLTRSYRSLVDATDPPVTFEDIDRVCGLIDALLCEKGRT